MGRVRSGALVAVGVVLVALLAASSASARRVQVHVNVKDQNGYRMSIEASRSFSRVIGIAAGKIEGAHPSAPVRAVSRSHASDTAARAKASESRPRGRHSGFLSVQVQNHHAISTYNVRGTVTHNRLFAKLGSLGRISLHFHLRHTRTTRQGCFREHERLGVFKGRLRFRGEDGYVDVNDHQARGKVQIAGGRRHVCRRIVLVSPSGRPHHKAGSAAKPARGHRHELDRYTLFYALKDGTARPSTFAAIKENRGEAEFFASVFELRGRVLIDREEYGDGKAADFRTSKRFKTARIEPSPRAFRGTGHFHSHEKHNRWKGSLATSFPGASHVRLAGRKFNAQLRRLDFSGVSARAG
jgi:hypothetical protein